MRQEQLLGFGIIRNKRAQIALDFSNDMIFFSEVFVVDLELDFLNFWEIVLQFDRTIEFGILIVVYSFCGALILKRSMYLRFQIDFNIGIILLTLNKIQILRFHRELDIVFYFFNLHFIMHFFLTWHHSTTFYID